MTKENRQQDDYLDRFITRYERARIVIRKLTDISCELEFEKRKRFLENVKDAAEVFDLIRGDVTEILEEHVKELDYYLKLMEQNDD